MGQITRHLVGAVTLCALLGSSPVWAGSVTRTSSFAYDASGQLIQEVIEPDAPALRLQTDYSYDAFGNKVSVRVSGVDIASRENIAAYDARGQFVSTNTNPLGHSESLQFDARFGAPVSQTGPNGLTTTWSYDSLGRKIMEVRSDGTRTRLAYLFCSGVSGGTATCVSNASYVIQTTPLAADGVTQNGPMISIYFDLLDREIARDGQGFDGGAIRAATQFNALGLMTKTSRPYVVANGTPQWTTFSYDVLGRVVATAEPDGSTSQIAYHGLTVNQINALNQTRTMTKNSQGQTLSASDPLGNAMTYAYDAVGNAVQTNDAVGNAITTTYDLRGRKVTSSDPDLGYWTYTYNVLGELVSQTDAKGQTSSFIYDKLGRMVQRVEADMTSAWAYDTAIDGIGKLTSAGITAGRGAGFQRVISYDSLGRPAVVATTIDSMTYAIGATYDINGRLSKVLYPSGFTTRYGYNSLGYANQLLDDTTSQVYWTANAMDAAGRLTLQTTGNGLVTARTFDPLTGRVNSIATGNGNAVQNLTYTYDFLGNSLSRSDANSNLSETFTYDGLSRLTSATVNLTPTPLSKTFSYDVIGNLLSKSDVGSYGYPSSGSPRPHAVMNISGGALSTTFTYDANGNQTSGLGRSISWTSYNRPASITQGARTISFLDDIDYQRFKQVTPEGATLYISAFGVLSEFSNPGATSARWSDYFSVGNVMVGVRTIQASSETLTTRYFHTDDLGSISAITNENGAVVERLSYDAWGKRRFPNGADDVASSIGSQSTRGFTGEEQLSIGGLVHLNGRVYDPLLARMTSADPTVPDPTNLQRWNRYSYVNNRPLAYVDPTGYDALPPIYVYPGAGSINPSLYSSSPTATSVYNPPYTIVVLPPPSPPLPPPALPPLPAAPPPSFPDPMAGITAAAYILLAYPPAAAAVASPSQPGSAPSTPQTTQALAAVVVDAPSPQNPTGQFVPSVRGSGSIYPVGAGYAVNSGAYRYANGGGEAVRRNDPGEDSSFDVAAMRREDLLFGRKAWGEGGGGGGPAGTIYVTPKGQTIVAPKGYVASKADNGKGLVLRPDGQALDSNANVIRYGEPSARYPQGYFRYYNSGGQPINPLTGRPGTQSETHIPADYSGPLLGYPGGVR